MGWPEQAATWLREFLAQPDWLDPLQPTIEDTPDWALLSAAPAFLLTFALMLFWTWPRAPKAAPRASAQTLLREAVPSRASGAADQPPTEASLLTTGIPNERDEDRAVRVFVSSTFIDMQAERDLLANTTFPALKRRFRERGVELLEVDLRWGVTEADVTLDVCLSEVSRCKPHFIGLIGQRYGTVLSAQEATPTLQAAFPAVRDGIGRSLTEIEIIHGVLNDPATAKSALFFERDPAWLATLSGEERVIFEEQSDQARVKLDDLRARIRRVATVHIYKSPADLGAAVEAVLGTALEARFPESDTHDSFAQTHRLHAAYARERLGPYVGAEIYLNRLDQWMQEGDAPLLIAGASGGGKSKLIAEWIQAWAAAHPDDILFAHYLGASPDSADPMLLMRRLWEHLNRATGEVVDLPTGNAALMDMAAEFAQRLVRAALYAEREGISIVIALDGLDKLSSEQNLRWLPSVLAKNVKLLTSTLDGEAKDAALARGWSALEVAPLSQAGRGQFIATTLKLWGKSDLPPSRKNCILAHRLSGLPLFLKTVLDELRVAATERVLDARLAAYLEADDMGGLFARVLARLERDYGQALVERALTLVWASRAGLEETEIIAMTDSSTLGWARLRNGLEDNLRDQAGRIAFSHDFLRAAVETRYLLLREAKQAAHLALAERFNSREPDPRQAEELPYQLRAAEAWDQLEVLLLDMDRFVLLHKRGAVELLGYWLPLKQRGRDVEALLCGAFESRAGDAAHWTLEDVNLAFPLQDFLRFAGTAGAGLQSLSERCAAACERLLGPEHRDTLTGWYNLGTILCDRGDLEVARKIQEQALEVMTRVLGPEHPDTITGMSGLARTIHALGDLQRAQSLFERVLEVRARRLGPEHPATLSSQHNLAALLGDRGDLEGAQRLQEGVLEFRTHALGPEHPDTLTSMGNLAVTLSDRGDLEGAQRLKERALEIQARLLGPEHPDTLTSMNNLAATLSQRGDLKGAQKLFECLLEVRTRIFGLEHPDTLMSMSNLAETLAGHGDIQGAERLQERTLELRTRLLGPEHPDTLKTMHNLAATLSDRGDLEGAQRLGEQVLELRARLLGPEHPDTLTSVNNLALTLSARGDLEGAQKLQEQAAEVMERRLGPEHPDTLGCIVNLAAILVQRLDIDRAEALFERVLEARERSLGPEHPDTLSIRDILRHFDEQRAQHNLERN